MKLFGKKTSPIKEDGTVSRVKVLGGGCSKCHALEGTTRQALEELGLEMPVQLVTDFAQIAAYGVMTTPALVVDDKVLLSGATPGKDEVRVLLEQALE